jgi:hypothetical protein
VLGRKFAAVHGVGKDDVGTHGLRDGQAPCVTLGNASLDTRVHSGEHDLDGVGVQARLGQ